MKSIRILIIDNYDSFTYNLLHLFAEIPGVDVDVARNDEVPLSKIEKGEYDGVIISPGPGDPTDEEYFGQNTLVIKKFGTSGLPILGVCLGFQGIATTFGAHLKQAAVPQHGKTSKLEVIESTGMFESIPSGTEVMRYHSLMIDTKKGISDDLVITAEIDPLSATVQQNGREIMGIRHKKYPIHGVQFHPESFATDLGDKLAKNFVKIIEASK